MSDAPTVSPPPPIPEGDDILPESCSECGRTFTRAGMIQHGILYICPKCKPVFLQKLGEGVHLEKGAFRYAGFWIRVLAWTIDVILKLSAEFVIYMIAELVAVKSFGAARADTGLDTTQAVASSLSFLVRMSYSVIMVRKFGATLGKMACGIKVVKADGGTIGYGLSFARYFAHFLSAITLYGYLMVAWDDQKRALHDRLCNTRVIYK